MKKITRASWFKSWFNSPYYNLLYGNRDEEEASAFIDRMISTLDIPANARILDVACGRGRHAKHLAARGFKVLGLDLSEQNIQYAKQFEEIDKLKFCVHDMREPFTFGKFDYIFNCFTSFGYFETEQEHIQSLQHIADSLKKDGQFILDFFNAAVIAKQLPIETVLQRGSIEFVIKKQQQKQAVVKSISFIDGGEKYHFEECVQLFHLVDFAQLLKEVGLEIIAHYGNYALDAYQPKESPRLILVARKR